MSEQTPEQDPGTETDPSTTTEPGTSEPTDDNAPQTVQEAGDNAVQATGEAYEKGYLGHVPSRDGDNPEDLTLSAVTGQNQGA